MDVNFCDVGSPSYVYRDCYCVCGTASPGDAALGGEVRAAVASSPNPSLRGSCRLRASHSAMPLSMLRMSGMLHSPFFWMFAVAGIGWRHRAPALSFKQLSYLLQPSGMYQVGESSQVW